eukprot:TRINITY_DN10188_c0_g1_i1.p1 TRINITY_DN10188_c0_g1~~TRINITY_DN10188_c0_g1_i1.p1  ORF type:complete len:393 (-),score=63.29 TRINITY_DN10188_c0_g1_i1:109-1224(-)
MAAPILDPLAPPAVRRLNDFDADIFDPPELRKRFVARYPDVLEDTFRYFDDKLIYWAQRFRNKPLYIWNLAFNAILSIELGIALPMVLFASGQDALGTEFTYVMLLAALVSQIPKRFIWRFRPFMQNRAYLLRPDMTSSFPSRAVTCAIVYSFLICYCVVYRRLNPTVEGWMPVFITIMVVLSTYARVQYGCHFPSDCMFAILQGLFICTVGTALYKADVLGCASCAYNLCYAPTLAQALNWGTFIQGTWGLFAAVTIVSAIVAVISIAPPLRFWGKCHHVYGMLLPCIAFQLTWLCPDKNSLGWSLAQPPAAVPWWAVIVGILMASLGTVVGMKVKGRFALLAFAGLYVFNFWILTFVRLSYYGVGLYNL